MCLFRTVNKNEVDHLNNMLRLTNKPEGTSTFQRTFIWSKDEHQAHIKNLDKALYFERNVITDYNEANARAINR